MTSLTLCLLGRHAWTVTRQSTATVTERCTRRGCRGRTERTRAVVS